MKIKLKVKPKPAPPKYTLKRKPRTNRVSVPAEPSRDTLSFGKYRGVPIEEVDPLYLLWVIDEIDPKQKPRDYELAYNEFIRRDNQGLVPSLNGKLD